MKTISSFYKLLKNLKMDISRYGVFDSPAMFFFRIFHEPGVTFCILYRIERYLLYESNLLFKLFGFIFYPFYFFTTYYILSYHIEPMVEIGGGLLLHNRDIVFTDNVKIGKNFACMGQTTIGLNFNSKESKIVIGNDVIMGVGAKVIASEDLMIANKVILGANAVVTKSIKRKNSVYGGVPAKYIKDRNF